MLSGQVPLNKMMILSIIESLSNATVITYFCNITVESMIDRLIPIQITSPSSHSLVRDNDTILTFPNPLLSLFLIAKSIDSRLEFQERLPVRYTLLLGKNFPTLKAFTICCWVKLLDDEPAGTLLSYANRTGEELQLTFGDGEMQIIIGGIRKNVRITFESDQWIHLAITWRKGQYKELL